MVRVRRRRSSGSARGGRVYWGAWIGDHLTGTAAPWDMDALTKFEQMVGKPVSLLQLGVPFANCSVSPCSFFGFPTAPFDAIRADGAIPFLSWSPESMPDSASEPNFQLSDLIHGAYDGYIRSFAKQAKAWGHPFFLRFGWEMNGNWFAWGEGANGNRPGEFAAAWRHVHDVFTSVGATNATWVWCPYARSGDDLSSFYPGDRYVDWTCLDVYNWGSEGGSHGWASFNHLVGGPYHQIVDTIAPGKPMLIAETGSAEDGGSKAGWIQEMFEALPSRYPAIRGLIWYETLNDGMDWPLESSESALASFAAGIKGPRYVANTLGGISTSPIPPP